MVWRALCVGAAFLLSLTGCPEEFGKHGRINKAVHKDLMERLRQKCTTEQLNQFCKEGMLEEDSLEQCG